MHIRSMGVRFGLLTALTLAIFTTPLSAWADVRVDGHLVKVRDYEICSKDRRKKPPACLNIVEDKHNIRAKSSCVGPTNLHVLVMVDTGKTKLKSMKSIVSTLLPGDSLTLAITDVASDEELAGKQGVFSKVRCCMGERNCDKPGG